MGARASTITEGNSTRGLELSREASREGRNDTRDPLDEVDRETNGLCKGRLRAARPQRTRFGIEKSVLVVLLLSILISLLAGTFTNSRVVGDSQRAGARGR